MSKGRQQERQVEKQNSMDKPKYRLSLRNESCWFAKELCTLDSSLFFKVCKHDSNYLINKHDSLHWVDLQFAGEEMRNGVSEGIDFIKGSLHVSWVLWLTVNFHIHYLVSICQQCYRRSKLFTSHKWASFTHKREVLWAVQVHTQERLLGLHTSTHIHILGVLFIKFSGLRIRGIWPFRTLHIFPPDYLINTRLLWKMYNTKLNRCESFKTNSREIEYWKYFSMHFF